MNLLGVATLYTSKFEESYQSFILVLELFENLKEKYETDLKSDCAQDNLSLGIHDIYLNISISLIGTKNIPELLITLKQNLIQ